MAAAKRTAQITVHTEGGENIKPQNRQIHYRRFEMDAIFEDFVFPNISNNQSFCEHGGHLWAERERQGGLEDHFQEKSILRINHNNFWGDGAVYILLV